MKQADSLLDHFPGVRKMVVDTFRVITEAVGNIPMAIIRSTSAPWQYALSPIPRVCRTPGAFSFLAPSVCEVQT